MSLTGPSKTIVVEPVRAPTRRPAPPPKAPQQPPAPPRKEPVKA